MGRFVRAGRCGYRAVGVYAHFGYVQDVAYVPPYFWCLGAEGIALIDAERVLI